MAAGDPGPSLSAAASQRVAAILEAAEASAADIRRDAEQEAEAIRAQAHSDAGRASESIETAVQRLEQMHRELGALISSLRAEGGAGAAAGSVASGPEAVGPVAAGPEAVGPVVAGPAAVGPVVAGPAAVGPVVAGPAAVGPVVAGPAAVEPVVAGPAASASASAADGDQDDLAGVRLIALNMALDGTPREQTARYLAENFSLADSAQLLDEVYASAGA